MNFCAGLQCITVRLGLLLLLCLISIPVNADELDQSKHRLQELEKKINSTLLELHNKQGKAGDLDKDLAQLETEIRRINVQVKRSSDQLEKLQVKLRQQESELINVEKHLDQSMNHLKQRLVTLYKTGDTGFFKTLLSSTDSPQALAEKYFFLSKLARHDRQLMNDYRQQASIYQKQIQELKAVRDQQAKTAERHRQEKLALKSAQKMKKSLLTKVRKDESVLETMLAELRAKAARLNDLVKKLESEQAQSYTDKLAGLFPQKGHLPWPVTGTVKVGFGTGRQNDFGALIESNGLEILVPTGTPVTAVESGQVIYASHLRGYGKLLIIDHGSKDYSVYAQISEFQKRVGDPVERGEKIGLSGFEGREYLYFEIRHQGEPKDPEAWLEAR